MPRKISPIKQKILLSLLAGISIGLAYSPARQLRILEGLKKEFKKIDEKKLKQEIQALYQSKMADFKENSDGTIEMTLTDTSKIKVCKYSFEKMQIDQKGEWDKKWRLVIFDVPEKFKIGRNALRRKLKTLGFYQFQKSVFAFPYDCKDEIDFLVEFFNIRKYVRYGILEFIDNDLHLRKEFSLS